MTVAYKLVGPTSQTLAPFKFSQGFKRGDIPAGSGVVCDAPSYQSNITCTWEDGSAKVVHVSGKATVTASTNSPIFDNNPTIITLSPGTPPTGTALTAASIATAAPTASVQCGAIGTATLNLTTPLYTFQIGPQFVEAVYRSEAGSTNIAVLFYIRMWLGGRMRIMFSIENHGYLDNGAGARALGTEVDRIYVPTITVNGTVVFTNGGAAMTHRPHRAWSHIAWIGGDPQITPKHDPAYLINTGLLPNYELLTPSNTALSGMAETYVPFGIAEWREGMGGTGAHGQIGLLPLWDARLAVSGDVRARIASENASRSLQTYPVIWRDFTTKKIARITTFPTWTVLGPASGGVDSLGDPETWEIHHHGSLYLIYLLTGDPYHLDSMALQVSTCFFSITSARGNGVNRIINPGQIRGIAWTRRTVGQYVAIAPTGDPIAAEYRTWLENDTAYWHSQGPGNVSASPLGYPISIGSYGSPTLTQAPWQYSFWQAVEGHLSDASPGFSSTANHIALRNWMYKAPVGLLGATGSANYHFTKATEYTIQLADTIGSGNPSTFYPDWGTVYTKTFGAPNNNTSNTLDTAHADLGPGGGYWVNIRTAINMAIDHNAPGAVASAARLEGATNPPLADKTAAADYPMWNIVPRSTPIIEPTDPPPTTVTPSPGRSQRLETPTMMAGRTMFGNPGLGLLGSEMAATGLNGPGYVAPALTSAEANYEVRSIITRPPVGGVFTPREDGSFYYLGPSDYFLHRIEVGGFASTDNTLGFGPGISRVDLNVGNALSGAAAIGELTVSGGFGLPVFGMSGTVLIDELVASGGFGLPAYTLTGAVVLDELTTSGGFGLPVIGALSGVIMLEELTVSGGFDVPLIVVTGFVSGALPTSQSSRKIRLG